VGRHRDVPRAELAGAGDADRGAARLERPGRQRALVLDQEPGDADGCTVGRRRQERRPAFTERRDVLIVGDRQQLPVPPQVGRPALDRLAPDGPPHGVQVVVDQQRRPTQAQVHQPVGGLETTAERAGQVRQECHARSMYESIAALVERMASDLAKLDAERDGRRHFHATYLRTTRAVAEEIDRGGFRDGAWLERWDLVFAGLYLDALEADLAGRAVPRPWRVAFDAARERTDLPPVRHVLLGMNAHINYDLPQALIAVITPAEFDDPDVRRVREADHR